MITILSGPTAVGKTTLAEMLFLMRPSMHRPVSCTTRAPKKGERNGIDYHFMSPEIFQRRVAMDHFAEYALVHGNWYGTLKIDLQSTDPDAHILLEIDVQGMKHIKAGFYKVKTIFIHPPSFEVLTERMRMRDRGESDEEIALRLSRAQKEIASAPRFDYEVINQDLVTTRREIVRIVDLPWASVS